MIGEWEIRDLYINYYWEEEDIGRQEISIEKTLSCSDRGNFKAAYNCHTAISIERFLTNYYFVEAIAIKEVQMWAVEIHKTKGKGFSGLVINSETMTTREYKYLESKLAQVSLLFGDYQIAAWRLAPVLKTSEFSLDEHDLFPRYYLDESSAKIEEDKWIEYWQSNYFLRL